MTIKRFTPEPGRELSALSRCLERHGGALIEISPTIVELRLPVDEYREKRCRDLVEDWRAADDLDD